MVGLSFNNADFEEVYGAEFDEMHSTLPADLKTNPEKYSNAKSAWIQTRREQEIAFNRHFGDLDRFETLTGEDMSKRFY
jgi:hypothetical protein